MPPKFAARVNDLHFCPQFSGTTPHLGGPIDAPGISSVLIGGAEAAVVGTQCTCAVGGKHSISSGSGSVFIKGKPAARLGDSTMHPGGKIISGFPKVIIGD